MSTGGDLVIWSIPRPPLPVFNGEGYEFWSIRMKTLFRAEGLWGLIEHGYDDNSEDEGKLRENRQRDAMALVFIHQAVHDSIFWRIAEATTSKEAWTMLQTQFQVSPKVMALRLQNLRYEFETLLMKNSETVQSFVSRTEAIVNQMRRYGDSIAEKTVASKILMSLTPKFFHVATAIEVARDLTTLTVNELSDSLQAHEAWINLSAEMNEENGLQVKGETSFAKGDEAASIGGGRWRGSDQSYYSTDYKGYRGNIQCFNCKKYGHVKADCWFC